MRSLLVALSAVFLILAIAACSGDQSAEPAPSVPLEQEAPADPEAPATSPGPRQRRRSPPASSRRSAPSTRTRRSPIWPTTPTSRDSTARWWGGVYRVPPRTISGCSSPGTKPWAISRCSTRASEWVTRPRSPSFAAPSMSTPSGRTRSGSGLTAAVTSISPSVMERSSKRRGRSRSRSSRPRCGSRSRRGCPAPIRRTPPSCTARSTRRIRSRSGSSGPANTWRKGGGPAA